MIGMLKGTIAAIGEEDAVIDVHGVGYLVSAGNRTLSRLEIGAAAVIHVETYVREDALKLFGFLSEAERAWYVRLQSVQGVGGKAALAILDALSASEVETAAALGDASAFERARGVGKKLAQRIAVELKDKAPPPRRRMAGGHQTLAAALADGEPVSAEAPPAPPSGEDGAAREGAVSALINLGYGESEARAAVAGVVRAGKAGEAPLIRAALKELAR
jgi:Holliday junction DNA helicase RuvA